MVLGEMTGNTSRTGDCPVIVYTLREEGENKIWEGKGLLEKEDSQVPRAVSYGMHGITLGLLYGQASTCSMCRTRK